MSGGTKIPKEEQRIVAESDMAITRMIEHYNRNFDPHAPPSQTYTLAQETWDFVDDMLEAYDGMVIQEKRDITQVLAQRSIFIAYTLLFRMTGGDREKIDTLLKKVQKEQVQIMKIIEQR